MDFNDTEKESKVKQEIVKESFWRKRQTIDDIELLTNIVRDMSARIDQLEQQLMHKDPLPIPSPTRTEDDDDTQTYIT
jgi:Tfp pilus assembly protein PilO